MSSWISSRARFFAEYFDLEQRGPEPGEIEFLLRRIREGGEPVLELGCGTGRVLVPLLESGVDIVGIDVSPDMLDRCRAKCAARGLPAELRVQAMQGLDLGRRFGTVFVGSGGLGVLDSEDDLRATFRGVFRHLQPRGVFSLEIETPPGTDLRFEDTERSVFADDGSVITMRMVHDYNRDTHVRRSAMTLERRVDGRLTETERHDTTMRFWNVATAAKRLRDEGFIDIVASEVFTDDGPTGDHRWLAMRARRR